MWIKSNAILYMFKWEYLWQYYLLLVYSLGKYPSNLTRSESSEIEQNASIKWKYPSKTTNDRGVIGHYLFVYIYICAHTPPKWIHCNQFHSFNFSLDSFQPLAQIFFYAFQLCVGMRSHSTEKLLRQRENAELFIINFLYFQCGH